MVNEFCLGNSVGRAAMSVSLGIPRLWNVFMRKGVGSSPTLGYDLVA